MKKLFSIVLVFTMLLSTVAYADVRTWESVPGHHNQSILLTNGEVSSKDMIQRNTRGEILSIAISEITNGEDGTLHVSVDTMAHVAVDKIYQTVFLDQWDEDKQDWIQIASWAFERSKEEEEDGELTSYEVGFTITDCKVYQYYRVRGLHLVQLGKTVEGCATETHGVQLTDIR